MGRVHPIVVLGPQRHRPTVAPSLEAAEIGHGTVALVTAGWEERESEVDELAAHLERPVENLALFRRSEQVLAADADLLAGVRRLRRQSREQAELYLIRLAPLLATLGRLARHATDPAWRAVEVEGTLEMIRVLDAHQEARVAALADAFIREYDLARRPSLAAHRAELAERVAEASAVALAGGNVGVLHDCLRLFGLAAPLATRPLVAWSAGAMVLSQRIVTFHDDPPSGEGGAYVHGPGLGLCPGAVFFPHARARLDLRDRARVERLARRMAPLDCVALEPGDGLVWHGTGWGPLAGGGFQLPRSRRLAGAPTEAA